MAFIKRAEIQANPRTLYVFGDNCLRVGMGGMAADFRGNANAAGVATKFTPRHDEAAFFTDKAAHEVMHQIMGDVSTIYTRMSLQDEYDYLLIPVGIGTGLAEMDKRAPVCYNMMSSLFDELRTSYEAPPIVEGDKDANNPPRG